MSAAWPEGLPCPQRDRQRTPVTNVVAFGTEVGPPKLRRRSTARTKRETFSVVVSKAQAAIFEAFFEGDLKDGTLPFAWTDSVTGVEGDWRFMPDNPYSLAQRASGKFTLSLSIEKLP